MISLSHIHPMLVHFPIALIVFGFIFDFASLVFKKETCLQKTGFYLLLAGTIMAILAMMAGFLFTTEKSDDAGDILLIHKMFCWLTFSLLILASGLRIFLVFKKKEDSNLKWMALVLYGLSAISVSITGYFGGNLVYTYMLGM